MRSSIRGMAALAITGLLGACALPVRPADAAYRPVSEEVRSTDGVQYGRVTHVERFGDGDRASGTGAGALIGGVLGAAIGREIGRDLFTDARREGGRTGGRERGRDGGRVAPPAGAGWGGRETGRDGDRAGGRHGDRHADPGARGGADDRGAGRDLGTLIGALAGAWLGHEIERQAGDRQERLRVDVELDRGEHRRFELAPGEDLRIGDRVRIDGQRLVRI